MDSKNNFELEPDPGMPESNFRLSVKYHAGAAPAHVTHGEESNAFLRRCRAQLEMPFVSCCDCAREPQGGAICTLHVHNSTEEAAAELCCLGLD